MARIEIITVFIISFISFLFLFSVNFVSAPPAAYSITITSPSSGTTINPVQVSGLASSTKFAGLLSAYTVRIAWGDGALTDLTQDGTHLLLTQTENDFSGTYNTSSDLAHTYANGQYNITVLLCHERCTGAEGGEATETVSITVVPPTCGITATPLSSFGSLNPSDISPDQPTTLTNSGTVSTTSLTISGIDWSDGAGHTIPVGNTHWALSEITTYETGDNVLLSTPAPLGINLASGASQNVHFRVQIPDGQFPNPYTQDITFTSGC
jgi:hypothetical protein